jgi:hypothetical protein
VVSPQPDLMAETGFVRLEADGFSSSPPGRKCWLFVEKLPLHRNEAEAAIDVIWEYGTRTGSLSEILDNLQALNVLTYLPTPL